MKKLIDGHHFNFNVTIDVHTGMIQKIIMSGVALPLNAYPDVITVWLICRKGEAIHQRSDHRAQFQIGLCWQPTNFSHLCESERTILIKTTCNVRKAYQTDKRNLCTLHSTAKQIKSSTCRTTKNKATSLLKRTTTNIVVTSHGTTRTLTTGKSKPGIQTREIPSLADPSSKNHPLPHSFPNTVKNI